MISDRPPFSPTTTLGIAPDYIHLWLLDSDQITETELSSHIGVLDANERAKAERIKYNKKTYLASRILMRKALAHYVKKPPQDIEFSRTETGKPFLINQLKPVYFNLSHSKNFVVLAVCNHAKAGVDIEGVRQRKFLDIAELYFHPREFSQLTACTESARGNLFFRLWTLKEALFKATGSGIANNLDKADFNFRDDKIIAEFSENLGLVASDWQFFQYQITAGFLCALAVNSAQNIIPKWFDGGYFF